MRRRVADHISQVRPIVAELPQEQLAVERDAVSMRVQLERHTAPRETGHLIRAEQVKHAQRDERLEVHSQHCGHAAGERGLLGATQVQPFDRALHRVEGAQQARVISQVPDLVHSETGARVNDSPSGPAQQVRAQRVEHGLVVNGVIGGQVHRSGVAELLEERRRGGAEVVHPVVERETHAARGQRARGQPLQPFAQRHDGVTVPAEPLETRREQRWPHVQGGILLVFVEQRDAVIAEDQQAAVAPLALADKAEHSCRLEGREPATLELAQGGLHVSLGPLEKTTLHPHSGAPRDGRAPGAARVSSPQRPRPSPC